LNRLKEKEDGILEKHHKETEAKYQADQAYRKDRAKRQNAAIDQSRQLQITLKEERAQTERSQAQLLAEHWKHRNTEIEAEEGKEAQDRWDKNWEIRYEASERSERAVRTPAGATTRHFRIARSCDGLAFVLKRSVLLSLS